MSDKQYGRCGTCRFFTDVHPEGLHGICCRFPPVWTVNNLGFCHPPVDAVDGCGEYVPNTDYTHASTRPR